MPLLSGNVGPISDTFVMLAGWDSGVLRTTNIAWRGQRKVGRENGWNASNDCQWREIVDMCGPRVLASPCPSPSPFLSRRAVVKCADAGDVERLIFGLSITEIGAPA
jgi:hypothetical protein